MIDLRELRKVNIFIELKEFKKRNKLDKNNLRILKNDFGIPKEDVYETLYVIYTQSVRFSLLNEILKEEYPLIDEKQYINVAKLLFNNSAYEEYVLENKQ